MQVMFRFVLLLHVGSLTTNALHSSISSKSYSTKIATPSSALYHHSREVAPSTVTTSSRGNNNNNDQLWNRRAWGKHVMTNTMKTTTISTGIIMSSFFQSMPSMAAAAAADDDDATTSTTLFDDLPPNAIQSYRQYRIPLQIATDYYLWDLKDKMSDPDTWGDVAILFSTNNSRGGQGQPNKLERDFLTPMNIIALSMPPDVADDLRLSQFALERAFGNIQRATGNMRRDLPVALDPNDIRRAQQGWEDGRVALNSYLVTLNDATGLNEMKPIPPSGPQQTQLYGRSPRKYLELAKKTKLCQNRGGPTLSQAWGGLMVTGYLQDSCGIPDLQEYFYQKL